MNQSLFNRAQQTTTQTYELDRRMFTSGSKQPVNLRGIVLETLFRTQRDE